MTQNLFRVFLFSFRSSKRSVFSPRQPPWLFSLSPFSTHQQQSNLVTSLLQQQQQQRPFFPLCHLKELVFQRMASSNPGNPRTSIQKSESEWKKELSPQEYHVLRRKGTESAGTGEFDDFYPPEGYFICRACKVPLYTAEAKFKSGCGWPAFDKCIRGSLKTEVDQSLGRLRMEIMCASCGGHLGHVFEGERFTETNERHCVNSLSVKFVKKPLPKEYQEDGEEILTKSK